MHEEDFHTETPYVMILAVSEHNSSKTSEYGANREGKSSTVQIS